MPKSIVSPLLKNFGLNQKKLGQWAPFILALLIVTALISVAIAIIFISRPQDVRQQAAQITDRVILKTRGSSRDNTLQIDVLLNSKNYNMAGVELRGTIEGVATNQVSVQTSNPISLQPVVTELVEGTQAQTSSFFVSLFAPLDSSQPVTTHNQDQVITTFIIKNPPTNGIRIALTSDTRAPVLDIDTIGLEIASAQTYTYSNGQPTSSPDSDSSKKTCNQNCATDTECQSVYQCYKGQCRLRSNVEDIVCAGTPDKGLQRNCNQYCADSRECAAGYMCYFNQCRNPLNRTDSSCANPKPATISQSSNKGGTVTSTTRRSPTPTPTPKVVAKNVKVDVASKGAVATISSVRASVKPSVSPSVKPSASIKPSVKPSVSPAPTQPATSSKSSAATTAVMLVLILVGLGGIGFAVYKLLRR